MRILYKTLLISALLLLGSNMYAQFHPYWNYPHENEKRVILGVRGGLSASEVSNVDVNRFLPEFRVGVSLDVRIQDPIYFQSGLDFVMKGVKGTVNSRMHLNYLQLPLHIAYKPKISDNAKFVLFGGGYLAYGIAGKTQLTSREPEKYDSFSYGYFKKFDAGVSLGLGFEVSKFVISMGAELGLVNISDRDEEWANKTKPNIPIGYEQLSDNSKMTTFYATVGYRF